MIALMLALLTLLAFVIGIVMLFVKAPRTMVLISVATFLTVSAGWKYWERSFHLSHVPDALQVSRILYANEESWGFGPGGNEAGILVYALPEDVAKTIEAAGLPYFANLPPNRQRRSRDWRGSFNDWKATPVERGPHWEPDPESDRYEIYQYVCKYGFCIDIDENIRRQAAAAVNSPGSYYAYGRIGMIVVSPGTRRVIFMYNG